MEIKYLGHSCFQIKHNKTKLITDPYDPKMVGLKLKRLEADIVTVSHHHADHNYLDIFKNQPLVFDLPGEYEKNQIRITGYKSFHDDKNGTLRGENTLFKIDLNPIKILHCGDLGHVLNNDIVDEIGEIDILMIPVGGFYTIGPKEAVEVINLIEPKIVIPMHYNHSELNQEVFGKLHFINDFLEEFGLNQKDVEKLDALKESDINLDDEKKVVILNIKL